MAMVRVARAGRGGLASRALARAVPAGVLLLAAASAEAQCSVTFLNPSDGYTTNGNGIAGGMQVGEYQYQGNAGAALWHGSAASFVNLHPVGTLVTTTAMATDGLQQVGWGHFGISSRHATLWSGSAESFVDLNPAGSSRSQAHGVSGGVQVGEAKLATTRMSLWRGSPGSWTDITPHNAISGIAFAIDGSTIGGDAFIDGVTRAVVSRDTGATWTSLHPEGFLRSYVYSVSGDEQAGTVWSSVSGQHAALWHGTAESWTSLHPSGLFGSRVRSTFDGYQVGYTIANNYEPEHAALWNGSVESWVDLHSMLPPDFLTSQAYGIWDDGNTLMVIGTAAKGHGIAYAVVWSMPIPAPGAVALLGLGGLLAARRRSNGRAESKNRLGRISSIRPKD